MTQSLVSTSFKGHGALSERQVNFSTFEIAEIVVRFTLSICYIPVTFVKVIVGLRELLVASKTPFPSHFSVEKKIWSMYLSTYNSLLSSIDYIFIGKLL